LLIEDHVSDSRVAEFNQDDGKSPNESMKMPAEVQLIRVFTWKIF